MKTALGIEDGQAFNLKEDFTFSKSLKGSKQDEDILKRKNCAVESISISKLLSEEASGLEHLEAFKSITKANITLEIDQSPNSIKMSICKPEAVTKVLRLKTPNKNLPKQTRELHLTLRSFEDMVYYIGETLRDQNNTPRVNASCGQSGPIFKIADNTDKGPYGVTVRHNNKLIRALPVPDSGGPCDRSGTVMGLLNQLLLLNQSEEFLKAPDIINR